MSLSLSLSLYIHIYIYIYMVLGPFGSRLAKLQSSEGEREASNPRPFPLRFSEGLSGLIGFKVQGLGFGVWGLGF